MKRFLLYLVLAQFLHGQTITRVEYFIDTDPGYGNANSVSIGSGNDLTVTFTAGISSITDGFHRLIVRGRDANGKWSLPIFRAFYKQAIYVPPSVVNLNRMEYFINTDPGFGNATPVTVSSSPDQTLGFTADITALPIGFHRLYVRCRDANGKWSPVLFRAFYRDTVISSSLGKMKDAEYFVDTDPGTGNATPFAIITSSDQVVYFTADVTGVSRGKHTLFVRVKDAAGRWSLVAYKQFYKNNAAVMAHINAEDSLGNAQYLAFGYDTAATAGLDTLFGEDSLRTATPAGQFDSRFRLPVIQELTSLTDIHNTRMNLPFTFSVQPQSVSYPVALGWDRLKTPPGHCYLRDNTDTIVNVNMRAVSTDTIRNNLAGAFKIEQGNMSAKALLEGFFNGETQVRDTISAEIHSSVAPYSVVGTSRAFVKPNGGMFFNIPEKVNGTPYYFTVLHRNTIETWSANPVTFVNDSASLDFTASGANAYGSNQKLKLGKWCLYSGDVNQDGIVDFSDLAAIDNASFGYTSGYVATDVTGDDFVDFSDLSICDNNSFNFVSAVKPGSKTVRRMLTDINK